MIVRNDDVAKDSELWEIVTFCNLCDKYKFKIMQCITPLGDIQKVDSRMSNEAIRELTGSAPFTDNKDVYEFLLSRNDIIAVHGYYHEHRPSLDDIYKGKQLLTEWGFKPTYYVPPFNETTTDQDAVWGLKVNAKTQRLEDYHNEGIPSDEIVYLHSWRYTSWYSFLDLERALERIASARGQ